MVTSTQRWLSAGCGLGLMLVALGCEQLVGADFDVHPLPGSSSGSGSGGGGTGNGGIGGTGGSVEGAGGHGGSGAGGGDATATVRWARRVGGSSDRDMGGRPVFDSAGNLYLVGATHGMIDLDPSAPVVAQGLTDLWVARMAPDGTPTWVRVFESCTGCRVWPTAVLLDGDAGLIVAGTFSAGEQAGGMLHVGDTDLVAAGWSDGFLVALDFDGELRWAKSYGGPADEWFRGLARGDDGALYVVGHTSQGESGDPDIGFGPWPPAYGGTSNAFVARFSTEGEPVWGRPYGVPGGASYMEMISVAVHGDLLVTAGNAGAPLEVDGIAVDPPSTPALMVTGHALADGVAAWAHGYAPSQPAGKYGMYGSAVAIEPQTGSALVTGRISDAVDFGNGVSSDAGPRTAMSLRIDTASGNATSVALLCEDQSWGRAVVFDEGAPLLGGDFSGLLGSSPSGFGSPLGDAFVLRDDGAGSWSNHFSASNGSPSEVDHIGVLPGAGSVAIVGKFKDQLPIGGNELTSAGGEDVFIAVLDP